LWPVEALSGWNYDALLIADLADTKKIHARLVRAGVPKDKIVTLNFSRNGGSNKSS
jgi:hypothetical protein